MKEKLNQMDLFSTTTPSKTNATQPSVSQSPLAFQLRPQSLTEFIGQEHIWHNYPFLQSNTLPSLILYGPPGCGKTTLAALLAKQHQYELYRFNAVLAGIGELKKLISRAEDMRLMHRVKPAIFIDEIHRFNKAQQDALLPYVESGSFLLIGATTESPQQSINRALLSRTQIVKLNKLSPKAIEQILHNATIKLELNIHKNLLKNIAHYATGDVRKALNTLEALLPQLKKHPQKTEEIVLNHLQKQGKWYDKNGERHYDVISAFIKSMRQGDAQGAILWLAVMLNGGEDPRFIARRISIFAAEDIGNADPQATILASATLNAIEKIGMPEARIHLAQATNYMANAKKSRQDYNDINKALDYVEKNPTIEVPQQLKNH